MTTVVIVDDEPHIATVLRHLLEDEGYRVEVARNGDEALESIRREPPDLVLSDVMMPGLDGWGLARALRSDPALRAVPVVLMSAGTAKEGADRLYAAFVRKPFDLDEILQLVEEYADPVGQGPGAPEPALDGDPAATTRGAWG
jgi:CheY-like chemotaxis protein